MRVTNTKVEEAADSQKVDLRDAITSRPADWIAGEHLGGVGDERKTLRQGAAGRFNDQKGCRQDQCDRERTNVAARSGS